MPLDSDVWVHPPGQGRTSGAGACRSGAARDRGHKDQRQVSGGLKDQPFSWGPSRGKGEQGGSAVGFWQNWKEVPCAWSQSQNSGGWVRGLKRLITGRLHFSNWGLAGVRAEQDPDASRD